MMLNDQRAHPLCGWLHPVDPMLDTPPPSLKPGEVRWQKSSVPWHVAVTEMLAPVDVARISPRIWQHILYYVYIYIHTVYIYIHYIYIHIHIHRYIHIYIYKWRIHWDKPQRMSKLDILYIFSRAIGYESMPFISRVIPSYYESWSHRRISGVF